MTVLSEIGDKTFFAAAVSYFNFFIQLLMLLNVICVYNILFSVNLMLLVDNAVNLLEILVNYCIYSSDFMKSEDHYKTWSIGHCLPE